MAATFNALRAKITPAGAYVTCPKCGEPVGNPGDESHLWEIGQLQGTIDCICGQTLALCAPRWATS